MDTNHLKFVSILDAIEEIKTTLLMQSEFIMREELEPILRKLPKQNKYICRIHGTKPEHCRNFPKSKRHALDNDCKGFPTE
jgi:Fe-S-cluster containining protein